jgi:uncharacterized protein YhfF
MSNDLGCDAQVQQFWNDYAASERLGNLAFNVFGFGDSAELADELVSLVITGTKRATTSLPRDYDGPGQSPPKPGDLSIIVDGTKTPRCIIRTVHVEIKPMRDVDELFAWDEGEGDRSLVWWKAAHARYFARQGAREGFTFDDSAKVVLERFEVVWPPKIRS